jgi:hypothetical protein
VACPFGGPPPVRRGRLRAKGRPRGTGGKIRAAGRLRVHRRLPGPKRRDRGRAHGGVGRLDRPDGRQARGALRHLQGLRRPPVQAGSRRCPDPRCHATLDLADGRRQPGPLRRRASGRSAARDSKRRRDRHGQAYGRGATRDGQALGEPREADLPESEPGDERLLDALVRLQLIRCAAGLHPGGLQEDVEEDRHSLPRRDRTGDKRPAGRRRPTPAGPQGGPQPGRPGGPVGWHGTVHHRPRRLLRPRWQRGVRLDAYLGRQSRRAWQRPGRLLPGGRVRGLGGPGLLQPELDPGRLQPLLPPRKRPQGCLRPSAGGETGRLLRGVLRTPRQAVHGRRVGHVAQLSGVAERPGT